jgi:hypothetical protein
MGSFSHVGNLSKRIMRGISMISIGKIAFNSENQNPF